MKLCSNWQDGHTTLFILDTVYTGYHVLVICISISEASWRACVLAQDTAGHWLAGWCFSTHVNTFLVFFQQFRGSLKSLNSGIVTILNYGKDVPSTVSHVTMAHEIGHNMGSQVSVMLMALKMLLMRIFVKRWQNLALCTKTSEVDLSAFIYRLFREDFPSIIGLCLFRWLRRNFHETVCK